MPTQENCAMREVELRGFPSQRRPLDSAASARRAPARRRPGVKGSRGTDFFPHVFSRRCQVHRQDYVLGPGDARATEQPSVQRQKHQGVRVQPCDRVRPQHHQPSDLLQYCE